MARINNAEELTSLVTRIKAVVTPDKVTAFLDARFTAYDKEKKTDAFITLKDERHYLPYPYNTRFIAQLHNDVVVNDDFNI